MAGTPIPLFFTQYLKHLPRRERTLLLNYIGSNSPTVIVDDMQLAVQQ